MSKAERSVQGPGDVQLIERFETVLTGTEWATL